MSVVDLHVEPLLDRELAGPLTESEQRVLNDHLAHCIECRVERQARRDFAQALQAPPAMDGIDALVARTLGQEPAPTPSVRVAPLRHSAPVPRAGARRGLLIAALLLGSAAAAAFATEPFGQLLPSFAPAASSETALTNLADAVRQRVRTARRAVPSVNPASSQTPSISVAAPHTSDDAASNHDSVGEVVPATSESETVSKPLTAAQLFARANKLRHTGKLDDALKAYGVLDRKYPESAEARLSKSIAARLLLDQGQATDALEHYDDVLHASPDNVEALMGRAGALRRLGQRAAEARTLRRVVTSHPNSPHAAAARARLDGLE